MINLGPENFQLNLENWRNFSESSPDFEENINKRKHRKHKRRIYASLGAEFKLPLVCAVNLKSPILFNTLTILISILSESRFDQQ